MAGVVLVGMARGITRAFSTSTIYVGVRRTALPSCFYRLPIWHLDLRLGLYSQFIIYSLYVRRTVRRYGVWKLYGFQRNASPSAYIL